MSTELFITSRFFVQGFHATNCSHLSSLVPNSYLIVKEDKTLESYGLNAGMYSTTIDVSNVFSFLLHLIFSLENHSLHPLGMCRSVVCPQQQVHVPLPWFPIRADR